MSVLQRSLGQQSLGGGSSSPRKRSLQGTVKNNATLNSAELNKVAMEEELRGHWFGSMHASEFLNNFLPLPDGVPKAPDVNPFSGLPQKVSNENELYGLLINCVNAPIKRKTRSTVQLIPKYKMVDTSAHYDKNSPVGKQYKPDLSTYREDVDTETEKHRTDDQELPWEIKIGLPWDICIDPSLKPAPESEQHDEENVKQNGDGQEDEAGLHVLDGQDKEGNLEILEEDNAMETPPAGANLSPPFEKSTHNARATRGQLAAYAAAMNSRQHRLHSFTIFVFHPYARLVRFDRAGIIVSRRFNIREQGQFLADFLWRFARVLPPTRGIDDTVRRASIEEAKLAKKLLKDYTPPQPRPVIVFSILHEGVEREFIGWGSMSDAESLTGRATRPYAVVEKVTKKLCFLKDSWRAESLEPEAKILKTLNEEGVEHIPKWMCGGDVKDHSTRTHEFARPSDTVTTALTEGKSRIIRRIHHRFVEDCIGVPLCKFESTRDLLRAIYHASLAHKAAYERCHILHRDISSNNILLVWDDEKKQWNGVLIDWDLAKDIRNMSPRDHHLTGTWQFISTRLCMDCNKVHTLQDDLESLVLVLVHHAIRYTRHNKLENSRLLINQVFSTCIVEPNGQPSGGAEKYLMFINGGLLHKTSYFEVTGNPPLNAWILSALDVVSEWIDVWQHEEGAERNRRRANAKITLAARGAPPIARKDAFLKDHDRFIEFCKMSLDEDGWPQDDIAIDNCPPKSATSTVTEDLQSSTTSSGGKRSLEPTAADAPRAKRSRSGTNN